MQLRYLEPGTRVTNIIGDEYVYVAAVEQHPIWPAFSMIIWFRWKDGQWFHDCLSREMDMEAQGWVIHRADRETRRSNLARALVGSSSQE